MCIELLISLELGYAKTLTEDETEQQWDLTSSEIPQLANQGSPKRHVNPSNLSPRNLMKSTVRRVYFPSLFTRSVPSEVTTAARFLMQKGIIRVYQFNLFPKELFHRLQCRLNHVGIKMDIPQPMEAGHGKQSTLWTDALWMGTTTKIRALLSYSHGTIMGWFSPEVPDVDGEVDPERSPSADIPDDADIPVSETPSVAAACDYLLRQVSPVIRASPNVPMLMCCGVPAHFFLAQIWVE
eukprot:gene9444-3026_t